MGMVDMGMKDMVDIVGHVKSLSQTRPSVSRFGIFENILPIFCTDCCMFSNIRKKLASLSQHNYILIAAYLILTIFQKYFDWSQGYFGRSIAYSVA